jgi:ABC-type nickel/cobalt efflux system permease component RcnA
MRPLTLLTIIAGATVALVAGLLWATGGTDVIARMAATAQREFQTAMAGILRDLKAGSPGATAALLAAAFGYGVMHAAGPGHGKFLLGGYALGSRAGFGRLAAVTVAASLAQAATAVVFVYAGVMVFRWTRAQMTEWADRWLEPVSYTVVATLGLWLLWRGVRHLRTMTAATPAPKAHTDHAHHHAHHHSHDHLHHHVHGPGCRHAHAPTLDQVARLTGWRDAAALIGAVAIRPCTGAIFLLILTWNMGLAAQGIAGVFAMGAGTALVTLAVALASATFRGGALALMERTRGAAIAFPVLEIAAGGAIATIAATLLLRTI